MNRKNTAPQLSNILAFLEICRAYQIMSDGSFISKKLCIGKPSDRFLDSWERKLQNTGVNFREIIM